MNANEPARVLDEISSEQIPQDLDLLPGILAKIQSRTYAPRKRAAVPAAGFAGLLLVLVLLALIFSLPGVASALKKIIGYIPGVGAVDQSAPLRVLANPVTDARGGYTITVESAVLDPNRTVISYHITGQFLTWDDPTRKPLMCERPPLLRLEDGRELTYPAQEGSSGGGEARWKAVFPAVPPADQRAVLVLPCLADLPAGEGPQNWEIPLAFIPAPPDMTVFPVVEPPTATLANPASPASQASQEKPGPADEMKLTLQGIAALNDGYYLQTVLGWEKIPGAYEVQVYPDAVHLFDSAGQAVTAWPADQALLAAPAESQALALNLQTAPVLTPGPARLVVDYVGVSMAANTRFSMDLGGAPQPGQTWELNRDLEIDGRSLRVLSAEYVPPEPGQPAWLMLYLSSDSGILAVNAMDTEHEILGAGGSPGSENVPFRAGWRYKDGFPHGTVTVEITTITIRRSGSWSLTWTPPAAGVTPTAGAAAASASDSGPEEKGTCLDETAWQAAPGELPAGLSGRAVFSNEKYELSVSNINGSGSVPVGSGVFPDLSPDGKRIVSRRPEGGLFVRDVAGGGETLISGATQDNISDIYPMWSPDGQQIAFDRVADHAPNIYLVNADGTNLHAILDGPEDETLIGWAPDGRRIFYSFTLADAVSVRALDLQTGRSTEAVQLPPEPTQISLSPDGTRIVYTNKQGIYLAALNGGGPGVLLTRSENIVNPVWSPDSQWIALTYLQASGGSTSSLGLLQPDTCRFIQLGAQKGGWLWSWVP